MSTELEIAVVQVGGMSPDRTANVDRLIDLFRSAAAGGRDLVVFPELITTPYFCTGPDDTWFEWAEPIPGPTVQRFAEAARELDTAVVFGMFEAGEDGNHYNAAVVIDRRGRLVPGTLPDGSTIPAYRKIAIPKVASPTLTVDEKHFFTPGTGPCTFDLDGLRFGIVICYDRSFPELWQSLVHQGATMIVPVVSSLGWREQRFVDELVVRAFETQTWVVAANRSGPEEFGGEVRSFFGSSCVIDPTGEIVARAGAHTQPEILRLTIDLDAVTRQRRDFPLLGDKRWDLYRHLVR